MKQRTEPQNNSMHLWFRQLADALNDAGFDMQSVFEVKDVSVPWTEAAVKECLWRPIQEAMTNYESTTNTSTVEVQAIRETLTRHLAERLGVVVPPWPDRFSQGEEQR